MLLKEGDVISIEEGMKVYADVPANIPYANGNPNEIVRANITISIKTQDFAGKYIVTKTVIDGGTHCFNESYVYPDGWHVYCIKIDDNSKKIDFYQTGCFTAMIKENEIKSIGKAVMEYKIVS